MMICLRGWISRGVTYYVQEGNDGMAFGMGRD